MSKTEAKKNHWKKERKTEVTRTEAIDSLNKLEIEKRMAIDWYLEEFVGRFDHGLGQF